MGIVYLARDLRLERRVALKVMRPDKAVDSQARARFLREARAAAAVTHDHIVTVYEVDQTVDGTFYLAMAYLQGETLEDQLERSPLLPVDEVLRLGSEIAAGLAAAHAQGLIHRDVKPGNIFLEQPAGEDEALDRGPRVKLLDFGLARPLGPSNLTTSGVILGTPDYMSPDQARGLPLDARSDLFCLGSVLYRLATGELPFQGNSIIAILRAIRERQPTPPRNLRPELPEGLEQLLSRLLAKSPADRPASAAEVSRQLRALRAELAPAAGTPTPKPAPAPPPASAPPAETPASPTTFSLPLEVESAGGETVATSPPVSRRMWWLAGAVLGGLLVLAALVLAALR
jgi:serine/threonine protein kinase